MSWIRVWGVGCFSVVREAKFANSSFPAQGMTTSLLTEERGFCLGDFKSL